MTKLIQLSLGALLAVCGVVFAISVTSIVAAAAYKFVKLMLG